MFALALAIVCYLAYKAFGPLPSIFSAILFTQEPSIRLRTFQFGTEAISCLLGAALLLVMFCYARRPTFRLDLLAGIILGIFCLARNLIILWFPFVVFALVYLGYGQRTWKQTLVGVGIVIAAFSCVVMPWFVRNCLVTKSFSPLGAQGGLSLAYDYSNKAIETGGAWNPENEHKIIAEVKRKYPNLTGVELELVVF